jgi:hypothetical protein
MWVRRLALAVVLFAALPLQAQDAMSLEES